MKEIIRSDKLQKTQRQLDEFAWVMDKCFKVPGVNWRFGIESIIGLFPGAGDVVTGLLGLYLLFRAAQFRLPKVVLARMFLNSVLDVALGAIPGVGDLFDFVFKSNTRNMELFRKYAEDPTETTKPHWVFFGILVGSFLLIFYVVVATIIYFLFRFF